MGRPLTTGRYESRQELEFWVWHFYRETSANVTDVARICRVSDGTVNKILGRKLDDNNAYGLGDN